LAADRLKHAEADCRKAEALGGNLPEIAELSTAVSQAMQTQDMRARHRELAMAKAKEHIDDGRLSVGEGMLAELEDPSGRAGMILRDVSERRKTMQAALAQAADALEREDWHFAIDELLKAARISATDKRLLELIARTTSAVSRRIRSDIDQGRLDLAEAMLDRLGVLAGEAPDVRELRQIVRLCHRASGSVESLQFRSALEILRRLASILPSAEWIGSAIDRAEWAAEGLESLRSGPLGLLTEGGSSSAYEKNGAPADEIFPAVEKTPNGAAIPVRELLPMRFLIQVDGVGSFLVVRDRRVTVGPISSSKMPDVGLMADPGLPVVTLERLDDDYFIRGDDPVRVNDKSMANGLLNNGDKIALAPRCRMKFTVPNPASSSALLTLSGARLPQADVRGVILMNREIILGPGPSAHIRADHLSEKIVLFVNHDRLMCRAGQPIRVDRDAVDPSAGIAMGVPVRIGDVSLVVTKL
jgi:hypothetical protein